MLSNKVIKLIIFDLDGVLVDSCDCHFESLNMALDSIGLTEYIISKESHMSTYNGKPTKEKLEILAREKGLPREYFEKIWIAKQEKTLEIINNYKVDNRMVNILKKLKDDGYLLYCASNSIRNTLNTILLKLGIFELFDFVISCEDVILSKPEPEIYLKCFERANIIPSESLIVEDSPIGRMAAYKSGAHVLEVENSKDVSYESIKTKINTISSLGNNNNKYLNVVIPMAGLGTRFSQVGYTLPKPLISVNGKPMIQIVIENLQSNNFIQNFIFIVREEHLKIYNLAEFLQESVPNCKIITVSQTTEGAACTVLLSKEYINNDIPLIMANSDQYLEWNINDFLNYAINNKLDGLISTFTSSHPKWSYAKINNDNIVTEVAEKNPISNNATTGVYYWKRGYDFVNFAEMMISKNIRVNNEFYVCPVFNQAILNNKKIGIYECNKMWGLGTPEDLEIYLDNHK